MTYFKKLMTTKHDMRAGREKKIQRTLALRAFGEFMTRARADRLISVLLVCIVCVLMISKLNFALAVSVDGEFVGYVSSVRELEAIVSDVNKTASEVLGHELDLSSELSYRVALGSAQDGVERALEDKLYGSIEGIGELVLVCSGGRAVCAFNSEAEALEAVETLKSKYVNENTLSADFAEPVSVVSGYGNKELLDYQDELAAGSLLKVVTKEKLTVEEPVSFETEYIYDGGMNTDESVTLIEGRAGVLSTDYYLTRVNGELTGYVKADGVVTVLPVKELIRVGTKPRLSTGSYIWPCDGYISCKFGYREASIGSSCHAGVDIVGSKGDPVWAADGGVVTFAGYYKGYGNLVKIRHENGDVTCYAHNSKLLVGVGDRVLQGQRIAEMGRTGIASANHCHFELRPKGGDPVDPEEYLPEGVLEVRLCD